MTYEKLAKDYVGRSNHEILSDNWPIQSYTLHHPLTIDRNELLEMLPDGIDVEEILKLTRAKQKEIAKNVDINKLPVDRTPDYIGQIALYEVLRCTDYDTAYVVERSEYEWDPSGFTLFHLLLRQHFVNKELGYEDIDLISGLLEPREGHQEQIRFEELWLDRLYRNLGTVLEKMNYMEHKLLQKTVENLLRVFEWKNVSTNRIREWCDCSRDQAQRLKALLRGIELRKYFSTCLTNLGLVKSITKGKRNPSPRIYNFLRCTDVRSENTEYISSTLNFPSETSEYCLINQVFSINTALYSDKLKRWTLRCTLTENKSLGECEKIQFLPDYYLEGNKRISQRDVFFTAFYLSLATSYTVDMLPCSIEEYTSHYTGLKKDECAKGLRSIRRKNLIIPH
jgi:hypothetical protein